MVVVIILLVHCSAVDKAGDEYDLMIGVVSMLLSGLSATRATDGTISYDVSAQQASPKEAVGCACASPLLGVDGSDLPVARYALVARFLTSKLQGLSSCLSQT